MGVLTKQRGPLFFALLIVVLMLLSAIVRVPNAASSGGVQPEGMGGGEFVFNGHDEMPPAQEAAILAQIERNRQQLLTEGKLSLPSDDVSVRFDFPLRAANGLTGYGYHLPPR